MYFISSKKQVSWDVKPQEFQLNKIKFEVKKILLWKLPNTRDCKKTYFAIGVVNQYMHDRRDEHM